MKNITLSAPPELIEGARKNATVQGMTLNNQFRLWLRGQAVTADQRSQGYKERMQRLQGVDAGRTFSRTEMNER